MEFNRYLAQRKEKGQTPQSILSMSFDEAANALMMYHGKGIIELIPSGKGTYKAVEFVTLDNICGKCYEDNEYINSKRIEIVYGKHGSHIFPVKENYNG